MGIVKNAGRLVSNECSQVSLITPNGVLTKTDAAASLGLVRNPLGEIEQPHVNRVGIDLDRDALTAFSAKQCRRVKGKAARLERRTEVDTGRELILPGKSGQVDYAAR